MAEATAARLLGYLHSSPIERLLRTIVTSQAIGFDIYNLRSYECFKLYFNLWHGGGSNFTSKLRR
jgi:hypothetical protein